MYRVRANTNISDLEIFISSHQKAAGSSTYMFIKGHQLAPRGTTAGLISSLQGDGVVLYRELSLRKYVSLRSRAWRVLKNDYRVITHDYS